MIIPTFTLLDRLRKAREHTGLTQAAFAEKVGVSTVTYSRYESGARNVPDEVVARAAETTGIPISWFYETVSDTASRKAPESIVLRWDGDGYKVEKTD